MRIYDLLYILAQLYQFCTILPDLFLLFDLQLCGFQLLDNATCNSKLLPEDSYILVPVANQLL